MSNKNPIVSVVMPIYKHSKQQLSDAIYSILNQTFEDLELIIVDGSFDDKNFNIVTSIKSEKIKYYKVKGYINCLNYGIKKSTGKFIERIDSDDISYPNRIEEQVRFLEQNPQISLCSCLTKYFDNTHNINFSQNKREINLINLIKEQEFIHPAMMFRKDLDVKYENIKPLEDCLLFRKLLLEGKQFAIIDKVLFENYVSDKSIMATYPNLMLHLMSKINLYTFIKYFNYNLSYTDEILFKRKFSKQEIIEFLYFIKSSQEKLQNEGLDIYSICIPYFHYALSKCNEKGFIYKTSLYYQTFFKIELVNSLKKLLRFVFLIENEYKGNQKRKVIFFFKFIISRF